MLFQPRFSTCTPKAGVGSQFFIFHESRVQAGGAWLHDFFIAQILRVEGYRKANGVVTSFAVRKVLFPIPNASLSGYLMHNLDLKNFDQF